MGFNLLLCGTMALTAGCTSLDKREAMGIPTAKGLWVVEYAPNWNDTALSYAVINGPGKTRADSHVQAGRHLWGQGWAEICMPDGTVMPVLGTGRVFFVSETNKITELAQPVSLATFQAFLASKPEDYSLPALVSFAKGQP